MRFRTFSLSTRSNCCPRVANLVLILVDPSSDKILVTSIPLTLSSFLSQFPASSSPTIPDTHTSAPNSLILLATFEAPPAFKYLSVKFNIGTGASGEILLTFPKIYSSTIKSPITAIFFCLNL